MTQPENENHLSAKWLSLLRNLAIQNQIQWGGLRPKASNQGLFQTLTPQQFDKEKEKKNRLRPEKKREKESPFNKAGGGGSQGFWNKNTTQRVEIFISKPVGLDLDGPLRGGCVSQP